MKVWKYDSESMKVKVNVCKKKCESEGMKVWKWKCESENGQKR